MQAFGKLEYVQGKSRLNVSCILCSIKENDEKIVSLKIYEDDICFVVLNLYPFNPGHLMCVPNRHITKYTELTKTELLHLNRTIQGLQLLLDDLYNPKGYNIGINQGSFAGGSIDHLHIHLVPRYGMELGFIDIVGKTRVLPEGLDSVKKKITQHVNKFLNKEFFENFK
ncbi:MAG: HIT domain-containing protein [Candidatus Lokiarchaeota archaeon]|nr:HIT domain-containing protein [Candidatus Lokiarchaeota archaeon]